MKVIIKFLVIAVIYLLLDVILRDIEKHVMKRTVVNTYLISIIEIKKCNMWMRKGWFGSKFLGTVFFYVKTKIYKKLINF